MKNDVKEKECFMSEGGEEGKCHHPPVTTNKKKGLPPRI
jgi:hypothetical protein